MLYRNTFIIKILLAAQLDYSSFLPHVDVPYGGMSLVDVPYGDMWNSKWIKQTELLPDSSNGCGWHF